MLTVLSLTALLAACGGGDSGGSDSHVASATDSANAGAASMDTATTDEGEQRSSISTAAAKDGDTSKLTTVLNAAQSALVAAGGCAVNEQRTVGACSIKASGVITNGASLNFASSARGMTGQQTAVCSAGRTVWLPGSCDSDQALAANNVQAAPQTNKVQLSLAQLLQFNTDRSKAHEALPKGVPGGYSWYRYPTMDAGNEPPSNYTAITGWSQAFWAAGTSSANAYLQVQNHQTLVCHGPERRWSLVQAPQPVEGAEFSPDFVNNANVKLPFLAKSQASNVVGWSIDGAFHFWPAGGRGALPTDSVCGVLVLLQARALPLTSSDAKKPSILLGLGADYWLNKTAPWNNYTTNAGLGVGRLKLVGTDWGWYGFSTASDADVQNLFNKGFDTASN
ncbi:MAG TPA: hypothetical protein VGE47_01630 [Burkholderiaceae bacterium]